jgi:hypothetical protein
MPGKPFRVIVAGALATCMLASGCSNSTWNWKTWKFDSPKAAPAAAPTVIPPEVEGTVAEYAGLVGGGSLLVDGHGLVVGLGKNGSPDVPPQIKKVLVEYMLKQKVGSAMADTGDVTPSSIIADVDTAVVRMIGLIPPGAPKGWKFDVRVSALVRTGTRSLDGGTLYPFPMYLASGEATAPTSGAREWAMAEGSVFINPFLDSNNPKDAVRLREGRIIGGGTVTESRPIRLILRDSDYARCNAIQKCVNTRFSPGGRAMANSKNPSTIELEIPPAYYYDYEHFLDLVMHLPLQTDPGQWETHAMKVGQEIEKPGANADGLSLIWEAMGVQVVNSCRQHYASRNAAASYYSARAGIRLYDDTAGDVLTRIARTTGSPFQIPAIRELGKHRKFFRSLGALRELINDASDLVRIAAYEALVELGDTAMIQRETVGEFDLDLVKSDRSYVIYATQSEQKRIALFGRDMRVASRVFFDMPDPFDPANSFVTMADKVVEVDANGNRADPAKLTPVQPAGLVTTKQPQLMVFRSIPQTGGISDAFYMDFTVRSLVRTLGNPARRDANRQIMGLDLTYGQLVSVLYRMCEVNKCIPAKFVLQHLPGRETIYQGATTVGRPDMPGQ